MTATPVLFGHDLAGTTTARPSDADIGQPYWDSTLGTLVIYSGSAWLSPCVELQGVTAGTAAANKAIVLDGSLGCIGIASMSIDSLTVGYSAIIAGATITTATCGTVTASATLTASTKDVNLTALETHDPNIAGRVYRLGNQLMVSTG